MRIVVALGGNALLRRGQPLTAEAQRANVQTAAVALAAIYPGNELVITHGNGPQVGLLALQGAAYKPDEAYPLDVLGAQTEGMIGYMIEQELVVLRDRRERLRCHLHVRSLRVRGHRFTALQQRVAAERDEDAHRANPPALRRGSP